MYYDTLNVHLNLLYNVVCDLFKVASGCRPLRYIYHIFYGAPKPLSIGRLPHVYGLRVGTGILTPSPDRAGLSPRADNGLFYRQAENI